LLELLPGCIHFLKDICKISYFRATGPKQINIYFF